MPSAKPLILTVDANVSPLQQALRAGKATMVDFGKDADDLLRELDENFQKNFKASGVAMGVALQKITGQQITAMKRAAEAAVAEGAGFNPMAGMDSASMAKHAAASEEVVAGLRQRVAAIQAVIESETALEGHDQTRVLLLKSQLVATEALAQATAAEAATMRQQATVFSAIEAEMGTVATEAAVKVEHSHGRMGASSMMLMHSVRAASDSFAAGLPATMILTEQVSRLGEAAAYASAEAKAAGVASSGFLAVLGEWAVPLAITTSVLGTLIAHLGTTSSATADVSNAHETLTDKLDVTKHSYEQVIAAIREYNKEQEKSRQGTIEEARAVEDLNQRLVRSARQRLQAQLVTLESKRLPVGGNGEAASAAANAAQANEARALEQQIKQTRDAIAQFDGAIRNAGITIARDAARRASDPRYNIEQKYDDLRRDAEKKFSNRDALTARLTELDLQQKAEEADLKPGRTARTRRAPVDRSAAQDSAYKLEKDRLDAQLEQLRRAGVTDPTELATLEKAHLDYMRQLHRDEITEAGRRNKWSKDKVDGLLAEEDQVAEAQKAAVDAKLKTELAKKDLDNQIRQLEISDQLLQLQEQLAPTAAERVRIQQQILDNEKQIALLRANGDPAAVKSVNDQFAARQQIADRNNADPLQKYLASVRTAAGDTNTAFKQVEADGLRNLNDGLVNVISGTESLGQAFKHMADQIIADLARIALNKIFGQIFGGATGGGSLPSFGNEGIGPGDFPQFADGGRVSGPGGPRDDRVAAMLSDGEFVVNAAATRKHLRALHAINSGRLAHFADGGLVGADITYPRLPSAGSLRASTGSGGAITFDLRGAVMTQDLLDQMNRISARHAASVLMAAPSITRRDIADSQRQRIPS